jgi:hypothetical protein
VRERGYHDAARLKEIDHDRTLKLLLGWLPKEQPDYLRHRAIRCLGYNAFRESIPQIEAVIRNPKEAPELRCLAMNIGLRYMRVPKALDIAKEFAEHKNPGMRNAAYWVLSDYGNEKAWSVLRGALRTDRELRHELVYALHKSGDPEAGHVVYDAVQAQELEGNPALAWRYALVMKDHHITMAAPIVAQFVDSSDRMTKRYVTDYFVHNPSVLATQAIATNQTVLSVVQKYADGLQRQVAQVDSHLARFTEQEARLKRLPTNERDRAMLEKEKQEWLATEPHRRERIARDRAKKAELTSELDGLNAALHAAKQIQ